MQKVFAYALCAGMACFLSVIYTLLRVDWNEPSAGELDVPAASAPADQPPVPEDEKK